MTQNTITISSRKSPLAIWQSEHVQQLLLHHYPELKIDIKGMLTQGDKILETPLNKIGGKGLFVKELEKAIMDGEADIAVHSIKDCPMTLPEGFILAAICERDDPRDAFVSNKYRSIEELPKGAIVGSSSLRRQSQLLAKRPDLTIQSLRGNVGTRLQKCDDGHFDAIILAAAGLKRLKLEHRITAYIDTDIMLPAAGQGAVGVECLEANKSVVSYLDILNHDETRTCVLAERTITKQLGGSCSVPIGAYARIINDKLHIQGMVGWPDGRDILHAEITVNTDQSIEGGMVVANELISKGAMKIIEALVD